MSRPRAVLVIGGSDSCGGAGIQADLRVLAALGWKACSAITVLTAQHPRRVARIEPVPLAQLDAELHTVIDYYEIAAVKTGMLLDAERVAVVAAALDRLPGGVPLVVDPVMRASAGAELLDAAGREAMTAALLPRATLLTPNLDEAAFWLGRKVEDAEGDARLLAERLDTAVLLKGGHGAGEKVRDWLALPGGTLHAFTHPRVALGEEAAHGTGCRLAAAIAAKLADGDALPAACERTIHALQTAAEGGGKTEGNAGGA